MALVSSVILEELTSDLLAILLVLHDLEVLGDALVLLPQPSKLLGVVLELSRVVDAFLLLEDDQLLWLVVLV